MQLLSGLLLCATVAVTVGSASLQAAQFVCLALAVGGLGFETFLVSRRRNEALEGRATVPPLEFIEVVSLVALGFSFLIGLVTAIAPDTSWDGAVAHLALPAAYVREGRIQFLEGNAYSAYPQLIHSLYAVAFSLGGELAVTLLNWSFSILSAGAVYCLGRRIADRRCGLIAAAIFATTPLYLEQMGTGSLDVIFSGAVAAALSCFVAWRQERKVSWLVLAAFLAGSCWGIRHTAYIVSVLLIVAVVGSSRERRLYHSALFVSVMLVAATPWLVRSVVLVGNPLYPFFGSEVLADADIASLGTHESIDRIDLVNFLMFPWDIVMKPFNFDGWAKSPGPFVLLLGIPGLVVGGARARWLGLFCLSGLVCFFFFQQFARYLFPFFVPMMVVAALAAGRLVPLRTAISGLLVFGFCYGLVLGMGMVHFKLPVVLGMQSREVYLAERVERFPIFEWIRLNLGESLGPGESVLTLDPRSYYLGVRAYHNYEWLPRLRDKPLEEQVAWLESRKIRYFLYPAEYIEKSPGYAEAGYVDHLNLWRNSPIFFRRVERFSIPSVKSDGVEFVEIYRIRYAGE